MTQSSFAPILSTHAIERCAASVGFAEALPSKAFASIVEAASGRLQEAGFVLQHVPSLQLLVDEKGLMQPTPNAPVRFFSFQGGAVQLFVTNEMLSFQSAGYVRWQPFLGDLERILFPVLQSFLKLTSLVWVKLEYWDRFLWSGSWDDFDIFKLIRRETDLIAHRPATSKTQWHSHAGWFEAVGDIRRLTNLNIDVVDLVRGETSIPAVGIYSTLMDQTNIPGFGPPERTNLDDQFVVECLERQHLALKNILGHIITNEMAERISLNLRKSTNARS